MNLLKRLCLSALILTSGLFPTSLIYEKEIVIPTYGVDAPDANPRFYTGRVYQGAQGRIYPYPMSDVLTNIKKDHAYRAVYLENDFLKICVLPEIGGRIFEAVDKTNGYDFFYKQSVIKPSLIGMLGEWMSGGVEWNFPHHHRARTYMPMQHTLKQNNDGSVTLWLAEMDFRHRLRMLIGLTLQADSNLLLAELKFFNPTPFPHSILYFANPAVHVDSTYQVIFPPEVEYVVQHAKREFAQWPLADAHYGGHDYQNIDISWWKNLAAPVSFFAWDHASDYFAGYNHGLEAGVAYVADSHIAPGKKFFTFGCGEEGKMWDKMLTDSDGPYLELMAGAYSDNQPDYSWIQPYEVKTVKQAWFPIRNLGGMSYANLNGALYLKIDAGKMILNLNTVRLHENAQLRVSLKDRTILESSFTISPQEPVHVELMLTDDIEEKDITVSLSAQDAPLMTYTPVQKPGASMPKSVEPPQSPGSYKTTEELYLTGLRLVEFHNPQIDPYPYFQEALARDSLDVRVNTQCGIMYAQRGMWTEAELHLQRAVGRLTKNYTRPRDGEAHYYLGVAQRALGKESEAYDAFYRAAWNFAWRAAAFHALAELDCRRYDYLNALEHITEAIAVNAHNTRALNLKAVILRELKKPAEAETVLDDVLAFDALDPWAMLLKSTDLQAAVQSLETETVMEVASFYASAGFYRQAAELLSPLAESPAAPAMLLYDLAFYFEKSGQVDRALTVLKKAAAQSPDYFFPFRLESIDVLQHAVHKQPNDALAFYALGNLLYDWQPMDAIDQWRKAVTIKPAFPQALRNLAFGYSHTIGENERAVEFLENAVKLDPHDARLIFELDVLYEAINAPLSVRQQLFKKHAKTAVKRDDALVRYLEVQSLAGEYDAAINRLRTHHFNVWEGGGEIHHIFVDVHLMRGLQRFKSKNFKAALADFTAALEYPDNLEVGRPIHDSRSCRALVLLGQCHAALGNSSEALSAFQQAAELAVSGDLLYSKALALQNLGDADQASELYRSLEARGRSLLQNESEIDFFAKFGEKERQNKQLAQANYWIALGALGLGESQKAIEYLQKAYALNRNNIWVNYYLNN